MHDPGVLLAPERARALPEGSRERALASLALRQLWHMLYDPCPSLPEQAFEPFLAWAEARQLPTEWTIYLALRGWLEQPSPALVQELLAAAAARWTVTDKGPDHGVLLVDPALPGRGIVAWKSRSLAVGKRIVAIAIEGQPTWPTTTQHAILPHPMDLADAVPAAWSQLRSLP